MRKHFNNSDYLPPIAEIESATSLLLVNTHFSMSQPRPLLRNVVQVGGMHLKTPNRLPQVKLKVKLSMFLSKHHAVKTYLLLN